MVYLSEARGFYFGCLIYFRFTRERRVALRGEASASCARSEGQNGWETNGRPAAILARALLPAHLINKV